MVDSAALLDYRPGLPTADLLCEIRSLRRYRLAIERLVCRYLADLADRIAQCPGSPSCGGYIDVFEAAEQLLGFGARPTRERLRVGRALRQLPRIERALETGEIRFARVREITRVARGENEAMWLELGKALPMRELQRRVTEAGGRQTNGKSDRAVNPAPGPAAAAPDSVRVVLDLPIGDWIVLQKALQAIRDGAPRILTDAEAVTALARETLTTDRQHAPAHGTQVGGADSRGAQRKEESDGADAVGQREVLAPDDATAPSKVRASDDPTGSHEDPALRHPAGIRELPTTNDPTGSHEGQRASGPNVETDGLFEQRYPALRHAAMLLRHLSSRPYWSVDELCVATGLGAAAVSVALFTLELQGTVRREARGYYHTARAA